MHMCTHSLLHGREPWESQQGDGELLMPEVWSSFCPLVAQGDQDPAKLPPDPGALHHPSCELCIHPTSEGPGWLRPLALELREQHCA